MRRFIPFLVLLLLAQPAFALNLRDKLKVAREKEAQGYTQTLLTQPAPKIEGSKFYYNDFSHLNWRQEPIKGQWQAVYLTDRSGRVKPGGVADGVYREYHDNGQVSLEKFYQDGKLVLLKRFYENGALRSEDRYDIVKRQRSGERKVYDESGRLVKRYGLNHLGLKASPEPLSSQR